MKKDLIAKLSRSLSESSITLHIEPADRSVGIMAEGFSAWENDDVCWVELDDIASGKCTWYDNETVYKIELDLPMQSKGRMIEALLVAFANAYYEG